MAELVFHGLRSERRALLGWSISTVALVGAILAFWPSISGSGLTNSFNDLPPSVQAATGIADLGTASGYLQGQLFSTVVPLLFLSFAIGRGARAIAGEEERGTMDLLLATPIRRSRVVLEKALTIVLELILLALILWLSLIVIGPLVDIGISAGRLAAATLAGVALGFLYGAIALACSAGLGRRGLSLGIAAALAAAGFVYTSIAPFVSALSDNVGLSPFQHAYGYDPLKNGLQLGDLALLLGGAAVFAALAVYLFDRRDVR